MVLWHTGGLLGYSSYVLLVPDWDLLSSTYFEDVACRFLLSSTYCRCLLSSTYCEDVACRFLLFNTCCYPTDAELNLLCVQHIKQFNTIQYNIIQRSGALGKNFL